jgi:hypothetical protein
MWILVTLDPKDNKGETKAGQTGRLLTCYECYCTDNVPSVPPIQIVNEIESGWQRERAADKAMRKCQRQRETKVVHPEVSRR